MRYTFLTIMILLHMATNAQPPADSLLQKAETCFLEIKKAAAQPEAKIWGCSLEGPLMLVDAETRLIITNRSDRQGLLKQKGNSWYGQLPLSVNIANTSLTWGGVHWAMVVLPLPASLVERLRLLLHESFHRIQDSLALPQGSPMCDHLDTEQGRIWLRLELAALTAALQQPVQQRKHDIENALLFREYRYALFPEARKKEQELEWNEGLAEYTGVYASRTPSTDTGYLLHIPLRAATYPSFTRSMAYFTGPLYGVLLSQQQKTWTRHITAAGNFEDLAIAIYKPGALPLNAGDLKERATTAAPYYGGAVVMEEENNREQKRLAMEKEYTRRFVTGPVLMLQNTGHMGISFNPGNLFALGSHGTVYPNMIMTDDWGRLVVTGAALLKDWKYCYLSIDDTLRDAFNRQANTSATDSTTLFNGTGWQLELKKGWHLQPAHGDNNLPGYRTIDWIIER